MDKKQLITKLRQEASEFQNAVESKQFEDAENHSKKMYQLLESEEGRVVRGELGSIVELLKEYFSLHKQLAEVQFRIGKIVLQILGYFG